MSRQSLNYDSWLCTVIIQQAEFGSLKWQRRQHNRPVRKNPPAQTPERPEAGGKLNKYAGLPVGGAPTTRRNRSMPLTMLTCSSYLNWLLEQNKNINCPHKKQNTCATSVDSGKSLPKLNTRASTEGYMHRPRRNDLTSLQEVFR